METREREGEQRRIKKEKNKETATRGEPGGGEEGGRTDMEKHGEGAGREDNGSNVVCVPLSL